MMAEVLAPPAAPQKRIEDMTDDELRALVGER